MRRPLVRALTVAGVIAVCATGAAGLWLRDRLTGSLPVLDGFVVLPRLSAAVSVKRDALGIPTIRGRSREDVARALGFLHAQDRFFQMDLARRRAAGELAALVGPRALPLDRRIGIHRFRPEAQRAVALLEPADRRLVDAYAGGVNTGLSSLRTVPFEYLVLRRAPEPWLAEDVFLVVLSMFITLEDNDGIYESTLATMHEVLPPAMFELMVSGSPDWDSPIDGSVIDQPPIPGPEVYDLRRRRTGRPPIVPAPLPVASGPAGGSPFDALAGDTREEPVVGSNGWAVSGRLTPSGAALLANDIHLQVRVPNTWYRAVMEWPDAAGGTARVMGLTLPGHPALVSGSNTHVAWGFTNSYTDASDVVLLDLEPGNPSRYRTPDGWRSFEEHERIYQVAGGASERAVVAWTIWGPLLPPNAKGRARAYRWTAHSAERLAASVRPLESSRTLEEALDSANGLGVPAQNIVVADRNGRIGWSIYGSIPRRVAFDGRLPVSWADGPRWDGWLEDAEFPRMLDPAGGRIWTANQRVVGGRMLAVLGDGSYEPGSRAREIRDRLLAKERFAARDLLNIQLDVRATFLSRWRDLLLRTLTPSATASGSTAGARQALRALLEGDWSGSASPDSSAYRFTRAFRDEVARRVMTFALADCYEADPAFDHAVLRRREGPVWALVTARPRHLLDPRYRSWEALLLASVDAIIADALADASGPLASHHWSTYNVTAYRHPLSTAIPFAGRWLDMPLRAVPGDQFTPRVQWGSLAASARMVVSPGREQEGILHMPTGQSGHPMSPFYANSHDAWVEGRPTPFLPGPTLHTLTLGPGPAAPPREP